VIREGAISERLAAGVKRVTRGRVFQKRSEHPVHLEGVWKQKKRSHDGEKQRISIGVSGVRKRLPKTSHSNWGKRNELLGREGAIIE